MSIINIDMFQAVIASLGATEIRQTITTTRTSHHPPAVAPSNRIFLNVRRVRDGAGCLIMTREQTACLKTMQLPTVRHLCKSYVAYHASISLTMAASLKGMNGKSVLLFHLPASVVLLLSLLGRLIIPCAFLH